MNYRDTLGALGEASATTALAILAAHEAEQISQSEAVEAIALTVAAANARATVLADVAVAAEITTKTGTFTPALGLLAPTDDVDRLTRAAATLLQLLQNTPDPQARTARLARSEPLTRAAAARSQAVAASPAVTGWRRSVGSTCQLCNWWARDGRIYPADHAMPVHKGCRCTQDIVVTDRVRPVQK